MDAASKRIWQPSYADAHILIPTITCRYGSSSRVSSLANARDSSRSAFWNLGSTMSGITEPSPELDNQLVRFVDKYSFERCDESGPLPWWKKAENWPIEDEVKTEFGEHFTYAMFDTWLHREYPILFSERLRTHKSYGGPDYKITLKPRRDYNISQMADEMQSAENRLNAAIEQDFILPTRPNKRPFSSIEEIGLTGQYILAFLAAA